MSTIIFDIVFKKKTDVESMKLLSDSELHQLKLMICGKYRIYDINKLYIYYKNELISIPDNTKLKDIFKLRKVKIEITDKQTVKSLPTFQHFCKCKKGAIYICDKCDEFLCEICNKKKKHITHSNQVIKLKEYSKFMKNTLKVIATELDERIINDDAYQYFDYWNFDLTSEITNINKRYEYMKQLLEDMKQIQIDYLISLCNSNYFSILKLQIEQTIKNYSSININEDYEKMLLEKRKIVNSSKEILEKYFELKNVLIDYSNIVKAFEEFNKDLLKEIKERFNIIKKKYFYNINPITISYNNFNANNINEISNGNYSKSQGDLKKTLNNSNYNSYLNTSNQIDSSYLNNSNSPNSPNNMIYQSQRLPPSQNINIVSSVNLNEKLIFKLKDKRKILIFSLNNQTFKEKAFIDKGNFRTNMPTETDITQLNFGNKLYLLSGKKYNKFYYYDPQMNSISFLSNTLFSHYFGCLVYSPNNNSIYLIGGNNQVKCENINLDKKKYEWNALPSLNEERQEFCSMWFKDFIYVFFGFSPKNGKNLSSIERINSNTNDKFETIYLNEQINLSSVGCAKYLEEEELDNNDEILLLGGFDGKKYLDASLVFNVKERKIRDCDIVIPNMNKHSQFLFHKESCFIEINSDNQIAFDMKDNVHLISRDSYELFSEAPN